MKFPSTKLPVLLASVIKTPAPDVLPEITLAAAAVVPPMVLLEAPPAMETPVPLGKAAGVAAALRPILLPWTRLLLVPESVIRIPAPVLPEIKLPAPAAVPPIVLLWEPRIVPGPTS